MARPKTQERAKKAEPQQDASSPMAALFLAAEAFAARVKDPAVISAVEGVIEKTATKARERSGNFKAALRAKLAAELSEKLVKGAGTKEGLAVLRDALDTVAQHFSDGWFVVQSMWDFIKETEEVLRKSKDDKQRHDMREAALDDAAALQRNLDDGWKHQSRVLVDMESELLNIVRHAFWRQDDPDPEFGNRMKQARAEIRRAFLANAPAMRKSMDDNFAAQMAVKQMMAAGIVDASMATAFLSALRS